MESGAEPTTSQILQRGSKDPKLDSTTPKEAKEARQAQRNSMGGVHMLGLGLLGSQPRAHM